MAGWLDADDQQLTTGLYKLKCYTTASCNITVVPVARTPLHANSTLRCQFIDADRVVLHSDSGGTQGEATFTCERVCGSERLLRRTGAKVRNPVHMAANAGMTGKRSEPVPCQLLPMQDVAPGTCVTVCGASAADACVTACTRGICINPQSVPQWNESCVQRCTAECLRIHKGER